MIVRSVVAAHDRHVFSKININRNMILYVNEHVDPTGKKIIKDINVIYLNIHADVSETQIIYTNVLYG